MTRSERIAALTEAKRHLDLMIRAIEDGDETDTNFRHMDHTIPVAEAILTAMDAQSEMMGVVHNLNRAWADKVTAQWIDNDGPPRPAALGWVPNRRDYPESE